MRYGDMSFVNEPAMNFYGNLSIPDSPMFRLFNKRYEADIL